jgi:hypothetical protein
VKGKQHVSLTSKKGHSVKLAYEYKKEKKPGMVTPGFTFSFSDFDLTGVLADRKTEHFYARSFHSAALAFTAFLTKTYGVRILRFGVLAKSTKVQPVGVGEISIEKRGSW